MILIVSGLGLILVGVGGGTDIPAISIIGGVFIGWALGVRHTVAALRRMGVGR